MVILSYWHEWYEIEVRKWTFLEPGEAKTTIDSHHAQVSVFVYYPLIEILILSIHKLAQRLPEIWHILMDFQHNNYVFYI